MSFEFHQYSNEDLRKIWTGYFEFGKWVIFIPADNGKPFICEVENEN